MPGRHRQVLAVISGLRLAFFANFTGNWLSGAYHHRRSRPWVLRAVAINMPDRTFYSSGKDCHR
jgi:hypothetical protein